MKILKILTLLLAVVVLVGCGGEETSKNKEQSPDSDSAPSSSEFLPNTYKTNVGAKSYYYKNKSEVFYRGENPENTNLEKLENVDIESFKVLSENYAKDKNNAYFGHKKVTSNFGDATMVNGKRVETEKTGVDVDTFEVLSKNYARDKDHVYYQYSTVGYEEMKNETKKTFQVIGDDYAKAKIKGKDRIYSGRFPVTKAGFSNDTFKVLNDYYAKDKNGIHGGVVNNIIQGEMYDTFEIIDGPYAKDKNKVYHEGLAIGRGLFKDRVDADVNTFTILSGGYSKDKNSIYYHSLAVKTADVATFEVVSGKYAKDDKTVYFGGHSTIGDTDTDVTTFQVLNERYAKDKSSAYFEYVEIDNVDIETFEAIDELYAKDKNNIYFQDEVFGKPQSEMLQPILIGE